mmetsp:Transcript_12822/g.39903  ORF Transcript_12822/g.39903 Transcript_12822/m.39903 type:complete len:344 (-) Transcript_12822:1493-2524(-)
MHAKVDVRVSTPDVLQPVIIRDVLRVRREVALEQQAHRVALDAQQRLHADEDRADLQATHHGASLVVGHDATVALQRPPLRLDAVKQRPRVTQPHAALKPFAQLRRGDRVDARAAQLRRGIEQGVGGCARLGRGAGRAALGDEPRIAKRLQRPHDKLALAFELDVATQRPEVKALGTQRLERALQRLGDVKKCCSACGTHARREAVHHNRHLLGGRGLLREPDPPVEPVGELVHALLQQHDLVARERAERHRVHGAVQLWQRVQHHLLQARDAAARPREHILDQQRRRNHVGHILGLEDGTGHLNLPRALQAARGTAHQREAHRRHDRVHRHALALLEAIQLD